MSLTGTGLSDQQKICFLLNKPAGRKLKDLLFLYGGLVYWVS